MPKDNAYGAWPASGEIDLILSRGNRNYTNLDKHIGVEQFASSLHFGPYASLDLYQTALFMRNSKPGNGFNNDFHRYQMEWTPGNEMIPPMIVRAQSLQMGFFLLFTWKNR